MASKPSKAFDLKHQLELLLVALVHIYPSNIIAGLRFIAAHEGITWLNSFLLCLALAVDGQETAAADCFIKLFEEAKAEPLLEKVANELISFFGGGLNMACTTSHKTSTTVAGPGVCCAALSASGAVPTVGLRLSALNKLGKCIICEIKASTSVKHPGALVFKRGKAQVIGSQVSCPSSSGGCCALVGA